MSESLNVVAIFAHPDDLSFFCAGTLAKWAEQGHSVYAICCTSGNVGTLRTDLTKEQVAEMRERELRAANEILGVKETIMLGYLDAGFMNGPELRERLVYYVRRLRADRVVTFDPWVSYEVHPDHVMVGRMAPARPRAELLRGHLTNPRKEGKGGAKVRSHPNPPSQTLRTGHRPSQRNS
ncbi:MAG: PIG-L deacetylase family protein [Candidatus Freyarchaeota archaeon]